VGAHPESIGKLKAEVGPVCVGTITKGDFNNCSRSPEHVCVTFAAAQDGSPRLVVLGACDRHLLAVKHWVLHTISEDGEVLITTPQGLEETFTQEEKDAIHYVIPA
jgi:hypothetical protein